MEQDHRQTEQITIKCSKMEKELFKKVVDDNRKHGFNGLSGLAKFVLFNVLITSEDGVIKIGNKK